MLSGFATGETLIVADGINGDEWLKSLALGGCPNCNVRMLSPNALAREVAMRQGLLDDRAAIDMQEGAFIILRQIESGNAYFQNPTLPDAQAILAAIQSFRPYLDPALDEQSAMTELLAGGVVPEKNAAIFELFARYLESLASENRIDSIQLIRLVIAQATAIEARILSLKERPLNPLAYALLRNLNGGREPDETTLLELSGLAPADSPPIHIGRIVSAYGESNEIEHVLKDILSCACPVDTVVIALAALTTYAQLLFDSARLHGIPVTFGTGVPILNSGAAGVLDSIRKWAADTLYQGEGLARLIETECFQRERLLAYQPFSEQAALSWCITHGCLGPDNPDACSTSLEDMVKLAGRLRLSFDGPENARRLDRLEAHLHEQLLALRKMAAASPSHQQSGQPQPLRLSRKQREIHGKLASLEWARRFFADAAKGPASFLWQYTRIRTDDAQIQRLDQAALATLTQQITLFERQGCSLKQALDAIPSLLAQSVAAENSRPGHAHVCGLEAAQGIRRERLYVVGLGSDYFPGKQRENPILLDADYRRAKVFWERKTGRACPVPESEQRLIDREASLRTLLQSATARGTAIRLSFSSFSLAEQKAINPAGLLLELFQASNGADQSYDDMNRQIQPVGYFEPPHFFSETSALMHAVQKSQLPDSSEYARAALAAAMRDARGACTLSPFDGLLATDLRNRAVSPSMLEILLQCPYRFFVQYLLEIEEPERAGDVFSWLDALELGSLVHEAIETYSRQPRLGSPAERRQRIQEIADGLIASLALEKIPHAEPAKQMDLIARMLDWFVESDPDTEVEAVERSFRGVDLAGIRLNGRLDRLERNARGERIVVDYKTGGFISQKENDAASCLQVLLYCAMLAAENRRPAGGEYRYLRRRKVVACAFGPDQRAALDKTLDNFAQKLGTGRMPMTANAENCTYCPYTPVCGERTCPVERRAVKWASAEMVSEPAAQAGGLVPSAVSAHADADAFPV